MTAEEAIKDICRQLAEIESEDADVTISTESLCMAIEALKKQIPKKPVFVDTRFRYHGRSISDGLSLSKCYKCPGCNTHIFHVWDDENFCKSCGQKLDWGEQNERT